MSFALFKIGGLHVSSQVSHESEKALLERYQEALTLWLRWNDAYQRITASMYEQGADCADAETLLDQLDRLRTEAIVLSNELLDGPPAG